MVVGPTSSGKTAFGVNLALKYGGEIVSADSRQVYRGLDVGTGKDLPEYRRGKTLIPYHLIDVVSPNTPFNLAKYQKLATRAIADILRRGRLPIVVGGTGLYLQALADNYCLSAVKPNLELRQELSDWTAERLLIRLQAIKPDFADKLNNSDKNNPRRLVRYLEVLEQGGEVSGKQIAKYDFLVLGLDWPDEVLRERIHRRILTRLNNEDMVGEVQNLHQAGVSWKRLLSFGLEYKFITQYLLENFSYEEMIQKLSDASYRFAKRQKTWFKRWEKQGRKIHWLANQDEAEKLIDSYL